MKRSINLASLKLVHQSLAKTTGFIYIGHIEHKFAFSNKGTAIHSMVNKSFNNLKLCPTASPLSYVCIYSPAYQAYFVEVWFNT